MKKKATPPISSAHDLGLLAQLGVCSHVLLPMVAVSPTVVDRGRLSIALCDLKSTGRRARRARAAALERTRNWRPIKLTGCKC